MSSAAFLLGGLRGHQKAGIARNCGSNLAYHIVEDTRAVDRMVELERPTEEYYKLLRQDMAKRHVKVPGHVLDHLLSLEAFLDASGTDWYHSGVVASDPNELQCFHGQFIQRF